MMHYCKQCGGAPSWNPLTDNLCDECWERNQKLKEKEIPKEYQLNLVNFSILTNALELYELELLKNPNEDTDWIKTLQKDLKNTENKIQFLMEKCCLNRKM